MNEQIQNQIASLIEAARKSGSNAAEFISQHAPETVEQLLAWKFYSAASWAIILAILAVAMIFLFRWAYKKEKGDQDILNPFYFFTCAFSGIAFIILFFNSFINGQEAMKVKLAPNIVLMETLKEIVR